MAFESMTLKSCSRLKLLLKSPLKDRGVVALVKLTGLALALFDPKMSTNLVRNFWYLRRVSMFLAEVVTKALLGISPQLQLWC